MVKDAQPWKEEILPIFRSIVDRCPGALVEVKRSSLAWHYRGAPADLGFIRSRELIDALNALAPKLGFRVTEGNKVVEARPLGADKGSTVATLMAMYQPQFILALGDDRTDEDMFAALPRDAYSICIGLRPSHAHYHLRQQQDVLPFLQRICAVRQPETAQAT